MRLSNKNRRGIIIWEIVLWMMLLSILLVFWKALFKVSPATIELIDGYGQIIERVEASDYTRGTELRYKSGDKWVTYKGNYRLTEK